MLTVGFAGSLAINHQRQSHLHYRIKLSNWQVLPNIYILHSVLSTFTEMQMSCTCIFFKLMEHLTNYSLRLFVPQPIGHDRIQKHEAVGETRRLIGIRNVFGKETFGITFPVNYLNLQRSSIVSCLQTLNTSTQLSTKARGSAATRWCPGDRFSGTATLDRVCSSKHSNTPLSRLQVRQLIN